MNNITGVIRVSNTSNTTDAPLNRNSVNGVIKSNQVNASTNAPTNNGVIKSNQINSMVENTGIGSAVLTPSTENTSVEYHRDLKGLDFASSGHTGFASSEQVRALKSRLDTNYYTKTDLNNKGFINEKSS